MECLDPLFAEGYPSMMIGENSIVYTHSSESREPEWATSLKS
jgi:hypothetical protein